MSSKKVVVFVGGMHGAGKTTLCRLLSQRIGASLVRQRQQIIAVGQTLGMKTWEEIGPHHDELIESAARIVCDQFNESHARVLLVDCHYVIRSAKALRLAGRSLSPSEAYIHDLDPRFVGVLHRKFRCRFVLLTADPEITVKRFTDRPEDLLDVDNTVPALREQLIQEFSFFEKLIRSFEVPSSEALVLDNSAEIESALHTIERFLSVVSGVPAP